MSLDVIEIKITSKEITFIRIPKGKEGTFCTGVSETYSLSEQVKIIDEREKK
jgi:hypothetical protein